jgi:hypothetical protein
MFTNMLQGKTLLLTNDDWIARTGIPDPHGPMMTPEFISGMNMNLDAAKEYAAAVFAQADATFDSVGDATWNREIDGPFGKTTMFDFLATLGLYHLGEHSGEIAAIKGVQDMKGLPF